MKHVYLLLFFLSLCSCTTDDGLRKTNGLYYWKSTFRIDAADARRLDTLSVQRLYTRYFDVAWNASSQSPEPVSVLNFETNKADLIQIIPVVYITNETFLNIPSDQISELAANVFQKIEIIHSQLNRSVAPEIQIDCDWSAESRAPYFSFLRAFDKLLDGNTKLSATIRLHQVKYSSTTGIPPVDRGALMFYNLAHPKETGTNNSILDLDLGKQYLSKMSEYPLPLDVALPLFSSGALFQGDNFAGLINDVSMEQVSANPDFVHLKDNYFQAKKEIYLNNVYIYKNDTLRIDHCDFRELKKSAEYLSERLNSKNINVLLFHFGSTAFREMDDENIKDIYSSFN